MDIRIAGIYRLGRRIGQSDKIYLGTNLLTGKEVVLKMELSKTRPSQLLQEYKLYKWVLGGDGVPKIHWYGIEGDYNILIMEMLGPSQQDFFDFCNRQFSLKTVLMLVDQMITRIEFLHSRSRIYRDIKPSNFLMGLGKRGKKVNVVDFGLVKIFRNPKSHVHIPYKENIDQSGIEQSRRDDMESLGYVFMYFLRGNLPWQDLQAATEKQKYDEILKSKTSTPVEVLCKGFPAEFITYIEYVRQLKFDEKPDYPYLREMFKNLFERKQYTWGYKFDQEIIKKKLMNPHLNQGSPEHSSAQAKADGSDDDTETQAKKEQQAKAKNDQHLGLNKHLYRNIEEDIWVERQAEVKKQQLAVQLQKLIIKQNRAREQALKERVQKRLQEHKMQQVDQQREQAKRMSIRTQMISKVQLLFSRHADSSVNLLKSLGINVKEQCSLSPADIHSYQKRALAKFHPDKVATKELSIQIEHEEIFKMLNDIYNKKDNKKGIK